jgi:hypothetical protein
VHIEFHEAPGWLDDCFRSSLWTKILSAASESFVNGNNIAGDYATMTVTEGSPINGAGWGKDIGSLALDSDDYPQIRVRLRGRGTTPYYRVMVTYTDLNTADTGWVVAPTTFEAITLQLDAGKTIDIVTLYARSGTINSTAYIDYDYAVIQQQWPIVPYEHMELDADLAHTIETSGFRIRAHHDMLHGVTALRYRFDENMGTLATDLGPAKLNGLLVNTPTWQPGYYNSCLQFVGAASERVETGLLYTVPATGAVTIVLRVKGSAGATGVVIGSGKAPGGVFNRLQLNLQTPNIRIYAKDDAANVRSYTSVATVLDNAWHQIAAIVNPNGDVVQLYVDGNYDGQTAGALGTITLDTFDVTIGCLHNESGFGSYATCYVDEPAIYTRALSAAEIKELYISEPRSGVSRVHSGAWAMIYLAGKGETLVEKILRGRVIDREYGGADQPWVEFTGEDQSEVLQDRNWTREFASATQISAVAGYVIDDAVDELYKDIDATNRTIVNKFQNENPFDVLQKLAGSSSFATGELGANIFVDPGGCFRFKKLGAFGCTEYISDGADGHTPNIIDIRVKETIKGSPKMANDVKLVIFEAEYTPADQDAQTECIDGWSSPDPTDAGYPQSDFDRVAGYASIKFATTNPGTQYRMRIDFGEVDLTGYDEVRFEMKYGVGLTIDNFRFQMLKLGAWGTTSDYYQESGIAPQGAAAWYEYVIDLSAITLVGTPGKVVSSLEICAEQASEIGSGGFLIDKLRFIRTEKSVISSDATSQVTYGKRTLPLVDKNISSLTWAQNVADNIVANRKYPIVIASVRVQGAAQLGYRPSQKVSVTSLKDGLLSQYFQIVRARHRVSVPNSYFVDLDIIAAKTSISPPAYDALVGPALQDLETILAEWRKRTSVTPFYSLRSQYS